MPDNRDVELNMIKKFNEVMNRYSERKLTPSQAVINGVQILRFYALAIRPETGDDFFDFQKFDEALEETGIGKHRQTLDKRLMQGCLFEGLIRFGSSKNQAYEFLLDRIRITETVAKEAHRLFEEYLISEGENKIKIDFVSEFYDWILDFENLPPSTSSASERYSKASNAYDELTSACQEKKKEIEWTGYEVRRVSPYEKTGADIGSYEVADED